jgi:hypothetical protein
LNSPPEVIQDDTNLLLGGELAEVVAASVAADILDRFSQLDMLMLIFLCSVS